jgi:hypothetical protein
LNIFTMMYTGKPVLKSSAARQQYADLRRRTVWGNLIEAHKSMLKGVDEAPSLVPDSWELYRIAQGEGVLSLGVDPAGSIVYSNGSAIFCRDRSGQTSRRHKDVMIQQVIAAGEHAAVSQP